MEGPRKPRLKVVEQFQLYEFMKANKEQLQRLTLDELRKEIHEKTGFKPSSGGLMTIRKQLGYEVRPRAGKAEKMMRFRNLSRAVLLIAGRLKTAKLIDEDELQKMKDELSY